MVTLSRLIGLVAGFFFGIVLHEYAHAKTADVLGDKYPRMQGRLTLKPKAHLDPIGSIGIPAFFTLVVLVGEFGSTLRFLFGYGKPMEHNFRSLKNPKRDRILIALAGPATNIAIAAAAGFAGKALAQSAASEGTVFVARVLLVMMVVNVFILIVNVLPIPPLDGSKILSVFLSPQAQMKMQEYAQYLLLFLLLLFLFLQGVLRAMADPVCRAIVDLPCTPLLLF